MLLCINLFLAFSLSNYRDLYYHPVIKKWKNYHNYNFTKANKKTHQRVVLQKKNQLKTKLTLRNIDVETPELLQLRCFYRSSHPEVFLVKGVGCSPVNLMHVFTTSFTKNTSGRLLLFLWKDLFSVFLN